MTMGSRLSNDTLFKIAVAITHANSPEIGWSQILTGGAHIAPFSPLENDEQRSAAASLTISDSTELARFCGEQADRLSARYWALGDDRRDDGDRLLVDVYTHAQSAFDEIARNLDILPASMTIAEYLRRFRNMDWRLPEVDSGGSEVAR
jgi:hypothetical protein